MNPRQELKEKLILERRINIDGCEGCHFKPHKCDGIWHMNEIIFTRNHIRHLTAKKKEYYWDPRNCTINCSWFHERWGHSTKYRDFWRDYAEQYGDVQEFIDGADLIIKA